MLKIRKEEHLLTRLDVTRSFLESTLDNAESFCEKLLLIDPESADKPREVLRVFGNLRKLQERIFQRLLIPNLLYSDFSHGGAKGRHILTNAAAHRKSAFVFTTDISKFYPSISNRRVYRLFQDTFECHPTVSHWLTRACTYDYHLALGIVSSPILADQIAAPFDVRLSEMCRKAGLTYTRFVDDISISGNFDLNETKSGIPKLVERIVESHGFMIQRRKHLYGRIVDGQPVTQIRIRERGFDVCSDFIDRVDNNLADSIQIAAGIRPSRGLYFTESQIRGRIEYVGWVNPGRRGALLNRFNSIPWEKVHKNALALGLAHAKKRLVSRMSNESGSI